MRIDRIIPKDQVTVEFKDGPDVLRVTLAPVDSAQIDKMMRACRPASGGPGEVQIGAWKQKLLDEVLLNVEGLEDDLGNPVAYTKSIGAKLLVNDKFTNWIVQTSSNQAIALGEGSSSAKTV